MMVAKRWARPGRHPILKRRAGQRRRLWLPYVRASASKAAAHPPITFGLAILRRP
jgi:hypothetical protein